METLIKNLKMNVDALEEVDLNPQTDFVHLPQWDSLALLSTMAMLASEYGVSVESRAIASCKNLAELDALIQSKR